jgi:hypothetical protein
MGRYSRPPKGCIPVANQQVSMTGLNDAHGKLPATLGLKKIIDIQTKY